MKKLRVAINGFGRIGRVLTRLNLERNLFELVAINEINDDIENLKYLLKYDSIYRKIDEVVEVKDVNTLLIGKDSVLVFHIKEIENIPWYAEHIDIIIDASGNTDNYKRIAAHSDKFQHYISTCESKNIDTIVCDINDDLINPKSCKYISASTCDAIALSPILKAVSSRYEIEHGSLVTLHPWLSYQKLTDSQKINGIAADEDSYGLARAAMTSLIPKSTSAIAATTKLIPSIADKLHSFSYRIPTASVSSAVINLTLKHSIEKNELVDTLSVFQKTQRYETLDFNFDNTVSIDHLGSNYSCIIDTRWTKVSKRNIQLTYWYDNEWGYCSKLLDLIESITTLVQTTQYEAVELCSPVF
jgi:glyceraldehyde 3-phosphate dehydrogenase